MKEVIKDYTRRNAFYRGIPCYFNPINNELKGRNIIYDFFLNITLWFEIIFTNLDEFKIIVERDKNFE